LVRLGPVVCQYDEQPEELEEEEEDEPTFTHREMIRSYCYLVKDSNFYTTYELKDNCALKVRKFGSKVLILVANEKVYTHFNEI
jgi:hypothetical protein